MAYPTTLALITALWSGPGRTKSIALWSALGGGDLRARTAALRVAAGALLVGIGLPAHAAAAAVVALVLAFRLVPAHVNETTDPVDNLGGILSVLLIAAARPGDQLRAGPERRDAGPGARRRSPSRRGVAFIIRQRRARNPLYDLHIAGRRIFWVAACAGIIVFGSLMAAMFVGQQFLQNVLGYDTLDAGMAILPAAFCMVLDRSPLGEAGRGARSAVHAAHRLRLLPARIPHDAAAVERGDPVLGGRPGVRASSASASGFAGTPASHSLTGSVPVERAGMASGTADLQRDLGGAIMQSILGALLTAGYAAAAAAAIGASPNAQQVTDSVSAELTKSFASAEAVAQQYPQYASQITAAAKTVVPPGGRLGVHGGDRGDPPRGGARVLPLPEERRRATAPRRVPRHGHDKRDRSDRGGHDRLTVEWRGRRGDLIRDRLSGKGSDMDEELEDAAAEAGADAIEEAVAADLLHADAVQKAEMAVALEAAAEELAAEAVIEEAAAEELADEAEVDAEAAVLLADAADDEE